MKKRSLILFMLLLLKVIAYILHLKQSLHFLSIKILAVKVHSHYLIQESKLCDRTEHNYYILTYANKMLKPKVTLNLEWLNYII